MEQVKLLVHIEVDIEIFFTNLCRAFYVLHDELDEESRQLTCGTVRVSPELFLCRKKKLLHQIFFIFYAESSFDLD